MTTSAVIMLVVAVCTVWGGFLAAVVHLRRTPEVPDDDQVPAGPGDLPRTG